MFLVSGSISETIERGLKNPATGRKFCNISTRIVKCDDPKDIYKQFKVYFKKGATEYVVSISEKGLPSLSFDGNIKCYYFTEGAAKRAAFTLQSLVDLPTQTQLKKIVESSHRPFKKG